MKYGRVSVVLVAGAVMWGLVPPAQADAPMDSKALNPANVVYTFNKIRLGGIVRDISAPTHLRMQLSGDWRRAVGVNGKKDAVALRAISRGVINRSSSLIPERRSFAVTMAVKLRRFDGSDTPNLAQLGFQNDPGQWKVEALPQNGRIRFRVKGNSGSSVITSRRSIDDGEYHLVTCFRKKGRLGVIIDGATRSRDAAIGSVRSSRKVTIGNKHLRTADDQFFGNFDYFSIAIGRQVIARSLAKAPSIP